MPRARLLMLCAVALAAPAAATPIEFTEGAAVGGRVEAGGQWLVLWLEQDSFLLGSLSSPEPVAGTNASRQELVAQSRPAGLRQERLGASESPTALPAGTWPLGARGAGFLYVEAAQVLVEAEVAESRLHIRQAGWGLSERRPDPGWRTDWDRSRPEAGPILLGEEPAQLAVAATGVTRVAWAGLAPLCGDEGCPRGGGAWGEREATVGLANARVASFAYETSWPANATLELLARPAGFALAGPVQDLWVAGWVRLPLAQGISCAECPQNQTLWARGELGLEGIRVRESGRLGAEVSGWAGEARFDEQASSFLAAPAAVALGTGASFVATALLAKLAWSALVTRRAREPLEHPRRRAIFDLIVAKPGITFRAIVRETGIPVGTAAHHVAVLKRSGMLMERAHRATRRFFQNHGRHEADWSWIVLLREPAFKQLHEEVVRLVPCPQKDILARMAAAGWSRSTTQHRLDRMVANGILAVRQQGRYKLYEARPWPVAPAWGLMRPEPPRQAVRTGAAAEGPARR
jgi:predicted transcriptional regulator